MVFIITFSIATILFHCVDLSHPIKSFPAWSSKLFLLWNIFLYFDTAFLFFFFFNSWMIFHCVYLSSSMNMCSFCGDHLGCVCRPGRSEAGHRNACWDQERLHLSLKGKGSGGGWGPGYEQFSHRAVWSALLDTYLCSCLSITHARLHFCLGMSWNASQLPIVVIFNML